MLKIAIIGLGTISVIHKIAVNLSKHGELVAVCDINPEKKADYTVPFYTEIEEMLKNEELDCVHICLPHYLHVPTIALCSKYGIHVFTEKPVALNYNEATTIFNLEAEHNIKIGVCLQNRYNNTVVELKKLLQTNDYGNFIGSKGLVTWNRNMNYYNEAPWRGNKALAGGGVIINQAIHTLDLLSYIIEDFKNVDAKVSNFSLKETEIEDTVMCRLEYKNLGSSIFFATIAYADNSSVELEFIFEKAKFLIRNSQLIQIENGVEEYICQDQKLEGAKHYYGASHCDAIDKFYQAILNNNNEYINVMEGAKSIKVMDNIFASSNDNQVKIIK